MASIVKPLTDADKPWRAKVSRIIAAQARIAWEAANIKKDGTRYRKHHQYTLPEITNELVECLNTNDEARAKAIMMYRPEVERL